MYTPCGTRTRNLRIRSPTPCPLGQGGCCDACAIVGTLEWETWAGTRGNAKCLACSVNPPTDGEPRHWGDTGGKERAGDLVGLTPLPLKRKCSALSLTLLQNTKRQRRTLKLAKYTWPKLNWRPSACEADATATGSPPNSISAALARPSRTPNHVDFCGAVGCVLFAIRFRCGRSRPSGPQEPIEGSSRSCSVACESSKS